MNEIQENFLFPNYIDFHNIFVLFSFFDSDHCGIQIHNGQNRNFIETENILRFLESIKHIFVDEMEHTWTLQF